MQKLLLNFKKFLYLFFAIAIFSLFPTPVFSELDPSILDRQDEFFLGLPFTGQNISGRQKVVWKMVDSDQGTIPYEINLLDSLCAAKIGTVAGNSSDLTITTVTSTGNGFYIYDWDSADALTDVASVEDGAYCFEVKVTFLNGATPYVLSSKAKVSIQNKGNHKPELTSELPKLNIKTSEQFSYQVKASDEDGDVVKYNLISAPTWLTLNTDSGLLSGTTDTAGTYPVVLNIEDGKGGFVNQTFSINVSPASNGTALNTPSVVDFSSPTNSTVFSGQTNEIAWQSDDSDGLERQTIEYSNNGVSWVLVSQLDKNTKKVNWDISSLTNGEYYLRITTTDEDKVKHQLVSDRFIIANNPGSDIVPSSSIYNLSPLENSSVLDELTKISGNFLSGEKSIRVESVQIFFDGVEITKNCTIDNVGFSCNIENQPEGGLHKVKVLFQNESGESIEEEWSFSTLGESTSTPVDDQGSSGGFNVSSLLLIVGVICVVLLLLIIPWAIYLIWTRRNRKNDEPLVEKKAGESYQPPSTYKELEVYNPETVGVIEPATVPEASSSSIEDDLKQAKTATDEYAIGTQNLESSLNDDFQITEMEATEQPKWLTEEQNIDIAAAAKPVTSEGKDAQVEEINDDSNITQPHGLEPTNTDNGDA